MNILFAKVILALGMAVSSLFHVSVATDAAHTRAPIGSTPNDSPVAHP